MNARAALFSGVALFAVFLVHVGDDAFTRFSTQLAVELVWCPTLRELRPDVTHPRLDCGMRRPLAVGTNSRCPRQHKLPPPILHDRCNRLVRLEGTNLLT
jgi:hypothetical protein